MNEALDPTVFMPWKPDGRRRIARQSRELLVFFDAGLKKAISDAKRTWGLSDVEYLTVRFGQDPNAPTMLLMIFGPLGRSTPLELIHQQTVLGIAPNGFNLNESWPIPRKNRKTA